MSKQYWQDKNRKTHFREDVTKDILRQVNEGESYRQLARKYEVSRDIIERLCKESGIKSQHHFPNNSKTAIRKRTFWQSFLP